MKITVSKIYTKYIKAETHLQAGVKQDTVHKELWDNTTKIKETLPSCTMLARLHCIRGNNGGAPQASRPRRNPTSHHHQLPAMLVMAEAYSHASRSQSLQVGLWEHGNAASWQLPWTLLEAWLLSGMYEMYLFGDFQINLNYSWSTYFT